MINIERQLIADVSNTSTHSQVLLEKFNNHQAERSLDQSLSNQSRMVSDLDGPITHIRSKLSRMIAANTTSSSTTDNITA